MENSRGRHIVYDDMLFFGLHGLLKDLKLQKYMSWILRGMIL